MMRKIILSMFGMATLSTPTLTIVACNDTPLEITNDDIYDEPGSTGKINNICLTFMYALPKNKKPYYSPEDFNRWHWNLDNRFKIIGNSHAGSLYLNHPDEYWQLTLQKTKEKGIYVSEYQKSEKPIKNAQI